ncbi:MAG: MFS transporter [Chloroflexota bacterium]
MEPSVKQERHRGRIFGFPANVFFMGLVSLLTDVSSEMIFTLVPLFLANVLGAATTVIGLIGGLSESTDAVFRLFSGWFSDKMGRRKPLALLGYGISTLAKPFMYAAGGWGSVLAIRFSDRVGKGVRSSPRDALIASSLSSSEMGKGFGLHRAMDTMGAVIGLVAAAVIIYLVQKGGLELSLAAYQRLVLAGVVPAVLAVLVLLFFVHEKGGRPAPRPPGGRLAAGGAGFDARFKTFLVIMAVFTLGNSSDFFVILRAQDLGAPVLQITVMLAMFNTAYALVSVPAGVLSDRLGRQRVIALGWSIYALVYLGFAAASSLWQVWLLFIAYGVYYGVVEGVARAFVADLVPEGRRGTAYGLYSGVVGFTLLPASLLAGWLWQVVSPAAPFFFGAAMAFVAVLGMMLLVRER